MCFMIFSNFFADNWFSYFLISQIIRNIDIYVLILRVKHLFCDYNFYEIDNSKRNNSHHTNILYYREIDRMIQ